MYSLMKKCNSGWKISPLAAKLVFYKPCIYHDIFFAGTRVSQKNVHSALIGWSMLRFLATGGVGTSWLAVHALGSDSSLPTTECLQATLSVGLTSSWDGAVYSAATFPATVWSQFKLDLRERATTNEIKHEPAQTSAEDLLPSASHATANVSLLDCLQKLSSVTLNWAKWRGIAEHSSF